MKRYQTGLLALLTLFLMCFTPLQKKEIKLWLIGDSTMAIKEKNAWPETGWGVPFVQFFGPEVVVDNRAKNGRSTKSFLTEGRWKPVTDSMQEGDYVFIQFGHNDEVPTKRNATTEPEFKANLTRYVTETRAAKGIPILITPVARRKFDTTGKIISTHAIYSEIVRTVAREQKVPLIDLDAKSQALLQQFGPTTSELLYLYLLPGENPNHPLGKTDDTHFNELGARKMAELVLAGIRELKLPLVDYITGGPSVNYPLGENL